MPDVGGSLEALADELSVEESEDGEYLVDPLQLLPLLLL